jgi:hypothetical protein
MGWPIFKNLRDIDRVADDDVEGRARAVLNALDQADKCIGQVEGEEETVEKLRDAIASAYACIAALVPKLQRARGKTVTDITEPAPGSVLTDSRPIRRIRLVA